ncbi:MAG: nucleotide sugar dehydrogenase [Patescibacteria group bacterium]
MAKEKGKVAIVGLGYVGLPLALLASRKGFEVVGIDINEQKISLLNERKMPFVDAKLQKELLLTKAKFYSDIEKISSAETIVVCVPTPVYDNYLPNLEPVKGAMDGIAKQLKKGQLVILESTVNPGVSDEVAIPILEQSSGLKVSTDFYFAHCPERINPGDDKWDVENIPRVVGGSDNQALKKATTFYEGILSGSVKPMGSLKEAEAVKIVENSFRDINIAFVNELAQSFAHLGIDVVNVIEGAATKPFSFLAHFPGCGVGGHCIPVDPYYLIEYAKKNGFEHDFLRLARRINNQMPSYAVSQMVEGLNEANKSIKGSVIAVLGLAYKSGIDDCRESPAFKIIEELKGLGATVRVFDPFVMAKSDVQNLDEALSGATAVMVTTGHKIFKDLLPDDLSKYKIKVVVDGRNCLNKDKFRNSKLIYKAIGR